MSVPAEGLEGRGLGVQQFKEHVKLAVGVTEGGDGRGCWGLCVCSKGGGLLLLG